VQRDENFQKRMRQAEAEVVREFGTLDRDLVRQEFARVAEDLMRNATVTDLLPVLVYRQVRENLRPVPAASAAGT
jgi:hypothetical protein